MKLVLCEACGRHVHEGTVECPFCRQTLSKRRCDEWTWVVRASRSALVLSAGIGLTTGCSSNALYGGPPVSCGLDIKLWAPCGIVSFDTSCAGAPSSCTIGPNDNPCSVGPVTESCAINVTTGDGVKQTIDVTIGPDARCGGKTVILTPTQSIQNLSSPTCQLPDSGK